MTWRAPEAVEGGGEATVQVAPLESGAYYLIRSWDGLVLVSAVLVNG